MYSDEEQEYDVEDPGEEFDEKLKEAAGNDGQEVFDDEPEVAKK